MKQLPLEGVKVVELATWVAVPTACRLLADWGADVVKIETTSGDNYRQWGESHKTSITDDENPIFSCTNMNKSIVALNLKTEEGVAILKKAISQADIFATNVRIQSLEKRGLDYESVKELNPRIVYAFFSGFGVKGEDAARPGYDSVAFWARGGIVDWTEQEAFPARFPACFGDIISSSAICSGILAAHCAREKTGESYYISSALYANSLWCGYNNLIATQEQYGFPVGISGWNDKPIHPFAQFYRCKDGEWMQITIMDYNQGGFRRACKAIGLNQYIDDPRYSTLNELYKPENQPIFVKIVKDRFAEKTVAEWCQILTENDIPHERLVHYSELCNDPQAWENNFLQNVTFPSGRKVVLPNNPVVISNCERFGNDRLPGGVGCDTEDFLNQLGYSDLEIADFCRKGAVVCNNDLKSERLQTKSELAQAQ